MEIHGLGYILATADLPKVGPVLRLWLLPTVAGPWRTHIYSGASLTLPAPHWLPGGRRIMQALPYRRWARQFYPSLDTASPNGAKPVDERGPDQVIHDLLRRQVREPRAAMRTRPRS
ncbi:hypothetical protein [Streptomyces acidiscabies]|uniref:Uncharacterized protein n=1 Tax=Streptomyces acidiscabies TaxID=42234 RepID=A0AAP6BEY4_9ACTN|nr:hypothetical protein [Streptomyces acidiscabies]MDX2963400.1 hypothetical protein [Streptomyces acidiscabies]MDX3023134.1 hypothetical protein [Streptomyces acidiscabies]MDX3792722.1 hypothetical protein [Streptomyces acidiscabies]GAQ51329.1 hypothetical protein a10_01109 [Streptomyces acidiscabies]GAV38427.1 hypothetical protein Saa2_01307 [Streptomyces acidiscabies]